jgi:hypothetical protein
MRFFHTLPLIICGSSCLQAAVSSEMEQLFENYISLATELAPVLESATDKQSAENAAAPLYNLLPKVYDMRTALQNIENLTPEEATELQQKYANRMQTEWGKVYEHIFRIEKANCYQSLAFFKQFRALCMMLK